MVHVTYTRDEQDTFPNSILLRVSVPTNANAKVILEPLFPGARCVTLTEGNEILWSKEVKKSNVLQDPHTGLMTVEIGSGEYQYQAFWE